LLKKKNEKQFKPQQSGIDVVVFVVDVVGGFVHFFLLS